MMKLIYARPAGLARVHLTEYEYPKHIQFIEDELLEVFFGRTRKLLLSCPPRHGKSWLISRYLPAWWILHRPQDRIILASYEATFAEKWGREVREVVQEFGPYFGVFLKDDARKASAWETNEGGGMYTAGVGGPITGKGANLLILDDPIKNAEQALSPTYRQKTWDWFTSTAYTRLEPGGAIIVMHTRWHEDDLAGRLLASGQGWKVVNLPAIAEEDDPLGRKAGEALWPERYSVADLLETKETIGTQWFNALYQGRPSMEEGEIFKRDWWRFWTQPPKAGIVFQSWDLTFKKTEEGSFVVGQVWQLFGAEFYLLDEFRFRGDFMETLAAMRQAIELYPETAAVVVEEKANGPAVISALRQHVPGVVPFSSPDSKEARARAAAPVVEAGQVYLPQGKTWVQEFIDELANFPKGQNDDRVDAFSQAVLWARSKMKQFRVGKTSGMETTAKRRSLIGFDL